MALKPISLFILITDPKTVTKTDPSLLTFFINTEAFGVAKSLIVEAVKHQSW